MIKHITRLVDAQKFNCKLGDIIDVPNTDESVKDNKKVNK